MTDRDPYAIAAKHARAVERLRVTHETLGAAIELMQPQEPGTAGKLGLDLLTRELGRLGDAIEALQ